MIGSWTLRAKTVLLMASLAAALLWSVACGVWTAHQSEVALTFLVGRSFASLREARELASSLGSQKDILASYLLSSTPESLERWNQEGRSFEEKLKKVRESVSTPSQRDLVHELESRYIHYRYSVEQAISLRNSAAFPEAVALPIPVEKQLKEMTSLVQDLGKSVETHAGEKTAELEKQVRWSRRLFYAGTLSCLLLSGGLGFFVFGRILGPVRRLALVASPGLREAEVKDEVKELGRRVYSLMKDVDETQTELQQSREQVFQSEKLAMVGKLAAGMAHTIRNPLTSIKMRLFSLRRTLSLNPVQKEDFEVISEEIRHIDTTVQNFLEFSRPPKLKIQNISPSDVVDMAIQLLRHRIETYGMEVELYRQRKLPSIDGDPEQLKEVLVNLIINACEAMEEGGRIVIREEEGFAEALGRVVVIRVSDNGPGMPESIHEKVFQPFFTTKDGGTGLGLSIAARIIQDHRGFLNLKSREGKGTTLTITLPTKEGGAWLRSLS